MDQAMQMAYEPVSFGALVGVLLVVGALVWGFQAAFKSGKLEKKLTEIRNDESLPVAVREAAGFIDDANPTVAAQQIKGVVDPTVAQIRAELTEIKKKLGE